MKSLDKAVLGILFLFIIFSACGSKSDSAPCVSGSGIVSITVSPSNATLGGNHTTQQFTAVATDFNNQPICGITFTWTDTGNISCIDQKGLATIQQIPSNAASDTITASNINGNNISGTATLQYNGTQPTSGC
jgi:hypothetical protein